MKITAVHAHVMEAPIEEHFAFSQAWVDKRVGTVIEIETDAGITGWGDVYGPPWIVAAVIEKAYAPMLIGENPLAGDAIWERLHNSLRDHGQRGVAIQALSGVDIALWDIRGKHFGAPVHVLMGGPLRSEVKAYATGLYRRSMDQDENIAILSEEAGGYINQGFGAMKLKVGFGFDYDMTLIEILRGIIGFDVDLFMDANHGYDLVQAKKLALAAEAYDIGWFEEPVAPEDLESYRELRRITTIPIAGGECSFTRFDFRAILESPRAMDIIQPDTASAGGLTECKKIADMAVAHGARYNPHVWGTGIGLATAMQLLAVLPLTVPGVAAHVPMLEYDQTPHPFRQGLLVDPIQVENGVAYVPEGPGLGVEIKRDVLERYKVN
ncbi:MAG: mandelate racemase/muconate lactonizing enzyme family protein [Rhodospirillaceae bacterium]|nr:mandelate racemase/muconate lactonizing enzyme family protein [Rhodospirillaceae bacterium]MBT6140298.1 mandelate racemase/muconate lactonizing enzyme family protein [Rhodospirillaceae bacterium]